MLHLGRREVVKLSVGEEGTALGSDAHVCCTDNSSWGLPYLLRGQD